MITTHKIKIDIEVSPCWLFQKMENSQNGLSAQGVNSDTSDDSVINYLLDYDKYKFMQVIM